MSVGRGCLQELVGGAEVGGEGKTFEYEFTVY